VSRDMSSAMSAELGAAVLRPVVFVYLDFLSAPVRMWNGIGNIEWDEEIWVGVGDLIDLGNIEEASDGTATSMVSTLAGVPSDLTAGVYQDQWQGREAVAWLGAIDADGALIEEPLQIRAGIMDSLGDSDDGQSAVFTMTIETPALDQGNNRAWRLTNETQQSFFPGDKGLEYTTVLSTVPLRWGAIAAPQVQVASVLRGMG
jgi:hypothetical protein